jgi:hypothetical protein
MATWLICGGRDYRNINQFNTVMEQITAERGGTERLIHGGATGADRLASLYAKSWGIKCTSYPANWRNLGKAAGPIRNQQMIDEGKPDLVIAFPGGRGTADMVRRAKAAGIEVVEVKDE